MRLGDGKKRKRTLVVDNKNRDSTGACARVVKKLFGSFDSGPQLGQFENRVFSVLDSKLDDFDTSTTSLTVHGTLFVRYRRRRRGTSTE